MKKVDVFIETQCTTVLQPFVQDYPGELVAAGETILDFAEAEMMGGGGIS